MINFETMPSNFRIWDVKKKKFRPIVDIGGNEYYTFSFQGVANILNTEDWNKIRDRFIISQDTGLKDKNGMSIYTGDILRIETAAPDIIVGYVEFASGVCGIRYGKHEWASTTWLELSDIDDQSITIGNIWGDLELLEWYSLDEKENKNG